MKNKLIKGFIDPISLIGIGFLVVTLFVGTIYVNKSGTNLNIREKAASNLPNGRACEFDSECASGYCDQDTLICKTKPKTPTPTPTSTPPPNACIANGKCLGPGEDCCGNDSYTDNSCTPTTTRCGTKPKTPTPTATPQCSHGQFKCEGKGQMFGCLNGYWYPGTACSNKTCNSTGTDCAPTDSCIVTDGLGKTRCKVVNGSNIIETCTSTGNWSGTTCNGTCTNGVCTDCSKKPNVCNNSGGVNYCLGGIYYSRTCPTGTKCAMPQGECVSVNITQKDCDNCLKTNSPSECQGVCANIGKKIVDDSCTPGTKECFFGNLKTCSSSSTWGFTTCSGGCDEETNECVMENKDWHYKCSIAGDWSIYVHNKTLAVDWGKSQRCSGGCVNGSCKNIDNSTCQENVVSLDGFEKCENGVWMCIPNQTRRITLPGQSNLGEIFVCNQYQSITSSFVNSSFSCDDNNNLIEDNNGIKTTYPCKDDVCLNPKSYKFVTQAGCYGQEYINANICNDGAIIEPTSQGQCKKMCEKGAYVYTNPLDCIRDPKAVFQRTCTNDVKPKVLENNKIVERCSGGCSYGQCIPAPNSVCNPGDGYLVGSSDPCLVVCVNGRYQNTQICSSLIKTEGYWNNDDLLTLLKSINEFPERYRKTTNDILFERINQPYTRCMENCSSLASGGYSNRNVFSWLKIPGSIEIPDTGTGALTIEHEIIHAIDDMNSEIAREYAKATGCKQNPSDPNGNYIFTEDPYREYGTTNCAEGLAVTCGEEYMDYILSCNMKVNRPNSYSFCKNEVFGGKEYCDESSKSKRGNTLDKLIKLTKGLFTIVYAMDTTPSAMETKLEILIPGTTKASDIDSILDAHLEKITTNNKTIFTFESSDSSRPHLVYVENGIVIFVQIVFDKTNTHDLTNITKQLGAVEIKSFSTHGLNTPVYSYPSRGLSFFVEGDTNQIFMVQKYPPTNQEEFKNTIGANFTDDQYGDTFENISLIKEQIITNQILQRDDSYLDSDNVLVISILVSILTIAIIIFTKLKKNSPSNKTV